MAGSLDQIIFESSYALSSSATLCQYILEDNSKTAFLQVGDQTRFPCLALRCAELWLSFWGLLILLIFSL